MSLNSRHEGYNVVEDVVARTSPGIKPQISPVKRTRTTRCVSSDDLQELAGVLRDSGPCVVRKWRFGRPVPSVETTFTRPNPVGDVTN